MLKLKGIKDLNEPSKYNCDFYGPTINLFRGVGGRGTGIT